MKENISQLNISIDDLYKAEKQINVHLSDSPHVYSLVLKGRDKEPDCKLSSFGTNYFRTTKGLNRQKYGTIGTLQAAVKRLIGDRIDSDCEVLFSLSDEVYTF